VSIRGILHIFQEGSANLVKAAGMLLVRLIILVPGRFVMKEKTVETLDAELIIHLHDNVPVG
jgi:hypothetical protein